MSEESEVRVSVKRGVILVGHGGIPKDCPQELVSHFKRLEGERRAKGLSPSVEEIEADRAIRTWPRTAKTDPYQAGLEMIADHLRLYLEEVELALAYNEFCAPTLAESAEDMIGRGVTDITVVSTMLTSGGSHSEIEIPEQVNSIRMKFPDVRIAFAWPFDLNKVAVMLWSHIELFRKQEEDDEKS